MIIAISAFAFAIGFAMYVIFIGTAHAQTACFMNKELANKFIEQVGPQSGYKITIPCPQFNRSQTLEDESGK